ncbi:MAG: hypothetical protein M3H12_06150 [Chromatiales bacterium]
MSKPSRKVKCFAVSDAPPVDEAPAAAAAAPGESDAPVDKAAAAPGNATIDEPSPGTTATYEHLSVSGLEELYESADGVYKVDALLYIGAVAWRREATYPGCPKCSRKMKRMKDSTPLRCGAHGNQTPVHHFAMRVLLREDATAEEEDADSVCEVWVTLFDDMMKYLVSYKPAVLAVMSPEQRRDRLQDLLGTEVNVTLRKSTWGTNASYTVRDLDIIVEVITDSE